MQNPSGRGRWGWQRVAQGVWIAIALVLLANFVASIPAYYQLMLTICTLPNQVPCTMPGQVGNSSGQLTPDNVRALAQLHLSVTDYAAYDVTLIVVVSLLFWGVGLLIFWRKSDEWMGLFVSLLLVLFGATGVSNTLLATYAPVQSPLIVQILLYLVSNVTWVGLIAFLLTFPTGRLVPRWSWLVIMLNIVSVLLNPFFFPDLAPQFNSPFYNVAWVAVLFGSTLYIMVYRYVHIFDAVQRQQAKWFLFAAAVGIALGVLDAVLPAVVPADSAYQLLGAFLLVLSLAPVPLGLGIAILRYRLWDIDLIIRRTLIYGVITAMLAFIYWGSVLFLQTILRPIVGEGNDLAIVVSTLVIAALFLPLRRRIQAFIDRRFYRRKYDAIRTLEAFSLSLRDEVDLDRLAGGLVEVVDQTMQPAHVGLWLRQPDSKA